MSCSERIIQTIFLKQEIQREIADSDRRFNERIMQVKDAGERLRLRRLWLSSSKRPGRPSKMNLLEKASPKMKWRNTRWGRNTEYLKHDEVSFNFPKLWQILLVHGSAFDDEWTYKLTDKYVIRCPLGEKPQSGSFWEDKDRRQPPDHQLKLSEKVTP